MRKTVYGTFVKAYNVVEEDMMQPLENYETFNDFFTRRVKPRVIDANDNVILSPADAKILNISEVTGDSNILVKGITYKMGEFLSGEKEVVLDGEHF